MNSAPGWAGLRRPLSALLILAVSAPAPAVAETSRAPIAVVAEYPSGRPLFAKAADRHMHPASMTKLMTLYLVFEALEGGTVRAEDVVVIGPAAAAGKGAALGLRAGDRVSVDDLVRGAIVESANDAALALAERVAGSQAAFVARMNDKARALGLTRSAFANPTGHSAPGHRMSAGDVVVLAAALMQRFPRQAPLFAQRHFDFRGKRFVNRNGLLGRVPGADGLKTGMTAAGGYGLAGTAERGGRRLIVVVNGLATIDARVEEAAQLLEWGFRQERR